MAPVRRDAALSVHPLRSCGARQSDEAGAAHSTRVLLQPRDGARPIVVRVGGHTAGSDGHRDIRGGVAPARGGAHPPLPAQVCASRHVQETGRASHAAATRTWAWNRALREVSQVLDKRGSDHGSWRLVSPQWASAPSLEATVEDAPALRDASASRTRRRTLPMHRAGR